MTPMGVGATRIGAAKVASEKTCVAAALYAKLFVLTAQTYNVKLWPGVKAWAAMVVYEGWRWWAARVPARHRPSPLDTTLCGIMLVAHALGNSDYHRPDEVFHAWLRRWGFPAHIDYQHAVTLIEYDEDWESGSPKACAKFAKGLPAATLEKLA